MLHDLLAYLKTRRLAPWVGRAVSGFERFTEEFAAMDRPARWHLVSAAAFLVVVSLFYAPSAPKHFGPSTIRRSTRRARCKCCGAANSQGACSRTTSGATT